MESLVQFSLDFENSSGKEETIFPSALYEKSENLPEMLLSLMAYELKLTHAYDKLSSLSNSRTRLLPHQIESTHIVVNSFSPRFILADEVGLGKTIEAALIMKELSFRNDYKRVLIVVPSPLAIQWKQELKNKFNEDFTIVKRKNFVDSGVENWQNFDRVITSIDFIKNPKYSDEILKRKWNIVIFDEAHRLRRDYSKITRAYIFAEKIAKKCESLLLLSATPFRGKLEELFYLVHLVDPNILGPYQSFVNEYVLGNRSDLREKISKVLLRRRKVEVGGFTKRFAKTVRIDLSVQERQFYDETTDYVKREYNLAMNTQNRATGFVMIVFQKLLDSSVVALLNALQKRKFMIETKLHSFGKAPASVDDWDLNETEEVEEFISELETSAHNELKNIKRELLSLNRLILLGKAIREDRKSIKLRETLVKLKSEGNKKFIIFTQFRSTQDYLCRVLSDFDIVLFHGSLTADAKEDAISKFKTQSEILISTEAGGEGRNLQFANILFNYDLPWSPLKIEQRIGRIHRFGQKENVYIFNFASKDTVAEKILSVLTNKIKLFEDSIGASDALLGTIEDELDFNSSLMKFVTGSKTQEEIETEFDNRIRLAEVGFNKLNSLMTPKILDFNLADYYNHTLTDRQFTNSHLEKFITLFCGQYGPVAGFQLASTGNEIYEIKSAAGISGATFNSEIALQNDSLEFLAFGHPLVETAITHIIENKIGFRTVCLKGLAGYKNKIVFVFLSEFHYSVKRTEIFYLEFDTATNKIVELDVFPYDEISSLETSPSGINVPDFYPAVFEKLESIAEKKKETLKNNTLSIFKKEEYKVDVSHQKYIRQLEEKLMRQEAKHKWSPAPEKRAVINRTKNEIMKAREEHDRQVRKIRNASQIRHRAQLFQVYVIV
ncbi:MAG: DEAD/DEAH box helicase family protein [Leptospira sp.]|nr:DEAD/DEAH box helicase family protein [Leptospira sp.]